MMDFKDQYRHPLWQKKRLEALEAADYCCEICYDDESQLHVHHKRYVRGRMVWAYEVEELSVLCEACHAQTHKAKDALNELLSKIHPEGFADVVALIAGYCSSVTGPSGIHDIDTELFCGLSSVAFEVGAIAGNAAPEIWRAIAEEKKARSDG